MEEKNSFYKFLGNTFETVKSYNTIVMGDFNAKTGGDNIARKCLGKWATRQTNENEELLLNFLEENNFKIPTSFFQEKYKHSGHGDIALQMEKQN